MSTIYLSASEFLKKRNFDLFVPAFYHTYLNSDDLIKERKPLPRANPYRLTPTLRRNEAPFRPLIDENQLQRASYPLEVMIELYQKRIEFEIINEADIPEMFDGLDWYLISIKLEVQAGNEIFVSYGRKVLRWRQELYKHYYRFMQTHPTAKESLYPNNSPKNNLFHLMSITQGGSNSQRELDPLRAKAHPPYDFEGSIPRDTDSDPVDKLGVGGEYGISQNVAVDDSDRDFDFEDFMNRKV